MPAIGLLGGTFDPIHYGHLRLAEEMAEVLGLAHVRLMPSGLPPHRRSPVASAEMRGTMIKLAIAGNTSFELDHRELKKTTPCYMVESLLELREELGADTPISLFLGADAFAGLATWHQWERLFELAHLAVAHRPGYADESWQQALPRALRAVLAQRVTDQPETLRLSPSGRIFIHPVTQLDISASRLRDMLSQGSSTRYLTPDAVINYIKQHQLYR